MEFDYKTLSKYQALKENHQRLASSGMTKCCLLKVNGVNHNKLPVFCAVVCHCFHLENK